MLYLMVILLGAAGVVGYFQSEKAKTRRKLKEKRIGEKLKNMLEYGSFKMIVPPNDESESPSTVAIHDRIAFELNSENQQASVLKDNFPIGDVPSDYARLREFLTALKDDKTINGKCIRVEEIPEGQEITVSFEVIG